MKMELLWIGNRIKQLRKMRGYKNRDNFAYDIGISRIQLYRYERGEGMNVQTLLRVIQGLEISVEEFFRGMEIQTVSEAK